MTRLGHHFRGAPDDGAAAGVIEFPAVATEFRRARDTDPVSKTRVNQLVLIIGEADLERRLLIFHRHGNGIALGRVYIQEDTQLPGECGAEAAQTQNIGVRTKGLVTAITEGLNPQHSLTGLFEAEDLGAVSKLRTHLRAAFG